MKIVVCIKQVPDTADIKWTKNNTLKRDEMDSVINPFDEFALETALKIKEKLSDVQICAVSMGPNKAKEVLKEALALGCDSAKLICDKKFSGSDTVATSTTIASAIKKAVPDFDLIICGQFAIDGDTAQTGVGIAQNLKIPQLTYVKKLIDINDKEITAQKEGEYADETYRVKLPALICIQSCDGGIRNAKIDGYIYAQDTEIPTLTFNDLDIDENETGIKGSPTYVSKAFRPENTRTVSYIEPQKLAEILKGGKR